MSATIIQFPSQKVPTPRRSHSARGVCVYCFGWRPEVTDFSCYGLGKWCDGCEPILRGMVERGLRGSKAAR